jgi:hypothetical protein
MESKLDELLTVRMDTETYLEFQAACRLRGGSMSSIVHQYAVSVIYDEKKKHPEKFESALEQFRENLKAKRAGAATKKAKRSNTQPDNVVYIKSPYNYGIIADTTGIADHIVIKVLAGDTEGIDPQVVERIRIEAQKQLGKITDIGDKLANGRQ